MAELTSLVLIRAYDGRKLNVVDYLRDDGITYSYSDDGSDVITLTLDDPEWTLLDSGFFDKHKDGSLSAVDVKLDGDWWRIAQVSPQDDVLTLVFEPLAVALLRSRYGARTVSRNKMTRAEFARSLVKAEKRLSIGFFCPELHKKQPIAKSDAEKEAADRRTPSGAGKGKSLGTFVSTAYGPPWNAMQGTGTTAGGTNLHDGKRRYIVAADKSVLPLGTHVYIDPNPYNHDGTFLVDDTGGAINGHRIDFYVAEGREKQLAWGRQSVKVWKADGEDGGGDSTETIAVSYQYEVPEDKDYWTALQDLAEEVGWRCFIHKGVVYFVDDYQLLRARPVYVLDRRNDDVLSFGFELDRRGNFPQEASATVLMKRGQLWPGDVVDVLGAGPANGRWLAGEVNGGWFGSQIEISLAQPSPPKLEPAHETTTRTSDSSMEASYSGNSNVIAKGKEISDRGMPYVWGGGHNASFAPSGNPAGYDCSGYVGACLHAAGLIDRPMTSGEMMSIGKPGRGHEFTVWANGHHVFVMTEDGQKIKRLDTSPQGGESGSGPRVRYNTRSTAGFTPRHFEGH